MTVARELTAIGFAALEQPFPANRLADYQHLKKQRILPILMDEGIVSLDDLQAFHHFGLLDGVAMKVSRSAGLSESRRILEFMEQNGLLFFASGLTDPDVSLAASLHLFSAYGLTQPAALNGPQFLTGSILSHPIEVTGDQARVPSGSGLGVTVSEDRLRALQEESGVK